MFSLYIIGSTLEFSPSPTMASRSIPAERNCLTDGIQFSRSPLQHQKRCCIVSAPGCPGGSSDQETRTRHTLGSTVIGMGNGLPSRSTSRWSLWSKTTRRGATMCLNSLPNSSSACSMISSHASEGDPSNISISLGLSRAM